MAGRVDDGAMRAWDEDVRNDMTEKLYTGGQATRSMVRPLRARIRRPVERAWDPTARAWDPKVRSPFPARRLFVRGVFTAALHTGPMLSTVVYDCGDDERSETVTVLRYSILCYSP